jgi:hypothetical protein
LNWKFEETSKVHALKNFGKVIIAIAVQLQYYYYYFLNIFIIVTARYFVPQVNIFLRQNTRKMDGMTTLVRDFRLPQKCK